MDIDGRYEIGTASGSLLDALGELQVAMADDETTDDGADRWSTDGTTALPPAIEVPEASRRPSPSARPRATAARSSATRQESAAPIPSVVERIATMPRYRSESVISHPTGEAWLSPRQRQFCERPPV